MSLQLDNSAIERLLEDSREEALIHFAAALVVLAQAICPVGRTGHLRRSIERSDPEDAAHFIYVIAYALYSIFVERGTGVHAKGFPGSRPARDTPWTYKIGNRYITTDGEEARPFMLPALDMLARGT